MWNACGQESDRLQCVSVFESVARVWQSSDLDALALRRYEALLTRRAWRDIVPLDVGAPLPEYNNVLHAQRLFLLQLTQAAMQGRTDDVRDGLSRDFAFWRNALPSADTLIGQMIAVAALRQHFFFAGSPLRSMPAAQAAKAMPPDWTREFSGRSAPCAASLAAELASMKRILTDVKRMAREASGPAGGDVPTFGEKWLGRATDPLFQLQDTVNTRADRFMRLCEAFEVPLNQYAKAQQSWKKDDRKPGTSVYNPIGGIIFDDRREFDLRAVHPARRQRGRNAPRRAAHRATARRRHRAGSRRRGGRERRTARSLHGQTLRMECRAPLGDLHGAREASMAPHGILLLRRRAHFFFGFGLPYFFSYSSRIFS